MNPSSHIAEEDVTPCARELIFRHQTLIYTHTSHLFAILMAAQWASGVAAAIWISPRTWIGTASELHIHVWMALLLGGALTAVPVFLAITQPAEALTRHVVAVAQM